MARDLTAEPEFPVSDIQGDILPGLPKRHEQLIFFRIVDAAEFKAFLRTLHLTSMQECLEKRAVIAARKAAGNDTVIPTPGLNIAFTFSGLAKLGVQGLKDAPDLDAFSAGMAGRRDILGDPASLKWRTLKPTSRLHGVFILTGASHAEIVDIVSLRLAPATENGWQLLSKEVGEVRPDPVQGHEHFGYADGVSQPGVRGRVDPVTPLTPTVAGGDENQGALGQDLLWPGEFVFGYPAQNPGAASFTEKGADRVPPLPFMKDGAFLVVRRLAQLVPEFNASVKHAALGLDAAAEKASPDLLGAQMVGRWKSGTPLMLAPTADNPEFADNTERVNDFEFGGDREGMTCPWAAHVRKAYPRDDVRHDTNPTDAQVGEAEAFTQTHRMMRRGISFGPEVTEAEAMSGTSDGGSRTRGLLFKCYVTSIENQFEFVQRQWCNAADFSQPGSGVDPIIGQSSAALQPFLGAAPTTRDAARKPHLSLGKFVQMQGGQYFFAPSIRLLKEL